MDWGCPLLNWSQSMKNGEKRRVRKTIKLLDMHYDAFFSIAAVAKKTGHPVPTDTRGWSQIIVSVLTGIDGIQQKKGADLEDGSDVKGANTWEAIDTPRFNGVVKAGTLAEHSDSMAFLGCDTEPVLRPLGLEHRGSAPVPDLGRAAAGRSRVPPDVQRVVLGTRQR